MILRFFVFIALAGFTGCAVPRAPGPVAAAETLFAFTAPEASSVSVVGSFNQWDRDRHRLAGPDREGRWTVTLPLPPGRYEYLFLIDGSAWEPDPSAPAIDDGMGGRNSVLVVPPE